MDFSKFEFNPGGACDAACPAGAVRLSGSVRDLAADSEHNTRGIQGRLRCRRARTSVRGRTAAQSRLS
eukprot:scaffold7468_cov277-Pinguiococcus_pyrenoidosus.AAC.3